MATTQGIDVQAMLDELAAEMAEMDAKTTYKGYSVADLKTVFDAISDPADWKGPIATVCTGEAVMITVAAIEFYCGCTVRVSLDSRKMQYVIESEGYRRGPAGDH